jgi:hypothetical protein
VDPRNLATLSRRLPMSHGGQTRRLLEPDDLAASSGDASLARAPRVSPFTGTPYPRLYGAYVTDAQMTALAERAGATLIRWGGVPVVYDNLHPSVRRDAHRHVGPPPYRDGMVYVALATSEGFRLLVLQDTRTTALGETWAGLFVAAAVELFRRTRYFSPDNDADPATFSFQYAFDFASAGAKAPSTSHATAAGEVTIVGLSASVGDANPRRMRWQLYDRTGNGHQVTPHRVLSQILFTGCDGLFAAVVGIGMYIDIMEPLIDALDALDGVTRGITRALLVRLARDVAYDLDKDFVISMCTTVGGDVGLDGIDPATMGAP